MQIRIAKDAGEFTIAFEEKVTGVNRADLQSVRNAVVKALISKGCTIQDTAKHFRDAVEGEEIIINFLKRDPAKINAYHQKDEVLVQQQLDQADTNLTIAEVIQWITDNASFAKLNAKFAADKDSIEVVEGAKQAEATMTPTAVQEASARQEHVARSRSASNSNASREPSEESSVNLERKVTFSPEGISYGAGTPEEELDYSGAESPSGEGSSPGSSPLPDESVLDHAALEQLEQMLMTDPEKAAEVRGFVESVVQRVRGAYKQMGRFVPEITLPSVKFSERTSTLISTAKNKVEQKQISLAIYVLKLCQQHLEKHPAEMGGLPFTANDFREALVLFAKYKMENSVAMRLKYPKEQRQFKGLIKNSQTISENIQLLAATAIICAVCVGMMTGYPKLAAILLVTVGCLLSADKTLYDNREQLCGEIVAHFYGPEIKTKLVTGAMEAEDSMRSTLVRRRLLRDQFIIPEDNDKSSGQSKRTSATATATAKQAAVALVRRASSSASGVVEYGNKKLEDVANKVGSGLMTPKLIKELQGMLNNLKFPVPTDKKKKL